MAIGANGDAIFRRPMQLMGRDDLADPALAENAGRDARATNSYGLIGDWVAQRDESEVLALAEAEVPGSRIYSVADMFADPQFIARQMPETVKLPDGRDCRMPGIVPKLGNPGGMGWIGPALGEHTDAILAALGYGAEAIAGVPRALSRSPDAGG